MTALIMQEMICSMVSIYNLATVLSGVGGHCVCVCVCVSSANNHAIAYFHVFFVWGAGRLAGYSVRTGRGSVRSSFCVCIYIHLFRFFFCVLFTV